MNSPLSHEPALFGASPVPEQPFAWIGELSRFLRRNRMLLAVSVGIAVVLAMLYVLATAPRFTAQATLLVDMRQAAMFQQRPSVADAQIENALIESEVEVLRSPGLARKVVADLHLADDPDFGGRPSFLGRIAASLKSLFTSKQLGSNQGTAAEDRLVQQFLGMTLPHRIGLTYIIEIDATAKTADLAARLANGLTGAYLAEQLVVKDTSTRQAAGWLEARLTELQDKALKADQAVQTFKSQSGIVDTGRGFLNEQQLTELNSQLVAARGQTAEAAARLGRIRQMTKPGGEPDIAVSDVLRSPVINGLRERYLNDATRVAEFSAQYGRDHGAAILLRKEMVQLQAAIGSEIRRIEQTTESDLEIDRAGETAIEGQLAKLVKESATTDTSRSTLRSLQSTADTYRSLYVSFLQRAMQTAQDESFPVADARVITEARPPLTKSKPQTKLILAAGIVLGLGVGFGIALLREVLDRRLRSSRDVVADTGFDCLALLPTVVTGPSIQDAAFGLGIRRLQLRVQQQGEAGRVRLVGLIAPTAGAGTSMIATSLVGSLAASGHNAALLDLSGDPEPRSQMLARIEALQREQEFVVVDFPPLDRPSEAHTLFTEVGSFVLLIEAGRIDGAQLLDRLRSAGLDRRSVLGAALNRARPDA